MSRFYWRGSVTVTEVRGNPAPSSMFFPPGCTLTISDSTGQHAVRVTTVEGFTAPGAVTCIAERWHRDSNGNVNDIGGKNPVTVMAGHTPNVTDAKPNNASGPTDGVYSSTLWRYKPYQFGQTLTSEFFHIGVSLGAWSEWEWPYDASYQAPYFSADHPDMTITGIYARYIDSTHIDVVVCNGFAPYKGDVPDYPFIWDPNKWTLDNGATVTSVDNSERDILNVPGWNPSSNTAVKERVFTLTTTQMTPGPATLNPPYIIGAGTGGPYDNSAEGVPYHQYGLPIPVDGMPFPQPVEVIEVPVDMVLKVTPENGSWQQWVMDRVNTLGYGFKPSWMDQSRIDMLFENINNYGTYPFTLEVISWSTELPELPDEESYKYVPGMIVFQGEQPPAEPEEPPPEEPIEVNMDNSMSRWIWEISPPWLQNKWGTRIMQSLIGIPLDIIMGALRDITAAWIDWRHSDVLPDALDDIGGERRLPRYTGETLPAYRERLAEAWTAYADGGTPTGLVDRLAEAGFPDCVVERNINFFTPVTAPENGVYWVPNSSEWWSSFAVIVPLSPARLGPSLARTIGDGSTIGEPGFYIGPVSNLYSMEDLLLIRAIIEKWKPADHICSVIVFFDQDATTQWFSSDQQSTLGYWGFPGNELWVGTRPLRNPSNVVDPEDPGEEDPDVTNRPFYVSVMLEENTADNREAVQDAIWNYWNDNKPDVGEGLSSFFWQNFEWPDGTGGEITNRDPETGDAPWHDPAPNTRIVLNSIDFPQGNVAETQPVRVNVTSITPDTPEARLELANRIYEYFDSVLDYGSMAPPANTIYNYFEQWNDVSSFTVQYERMSGEGDTGEHPDIKWTFGELMFDGELYEGVGTVEDQPLHIVVAVNPDTPEARAEVEQRLPQYFEDTVMVNMEPPFVEEVFNYFSWDHVTGLQFHGMSRLNDDGDLDASPDTKYTFGSLEWVTWSEGEA